MKKIIKYKPTVEGYLGALKYSNNEEDKKKVETIEALLKSFPNLANVQVI